ncbi:exosome non-catalytic core subunit [Starmerella bacillaris]|uniref:Ribosomal RNA-processing protein 42 n=1 Tax=Starmerella bacillaris TaxID=1247836 RepID=A0AAV5RLG5_STABA|nr:exosome non-catalytic core subunit [Starmerella bacillaris]
MKLSNTELEFLRTSLTGTPVIRPDSRHAGQLRPIESEIDILPMTYGSARVRAPDGSDCIVGVKAKVVNRHDDLIDVSVDIAGLKDNDALPNSLALVLKQVLDSCPEITNNALIINDKYGFNLSVDCVVLSYSSHPLVILSAAIFQALKSTHLPKQLDSLEMDENMDLTKTKTADEAEIPQFDDDWSQSVPLCPEGWTPPLLFIVSAINNTVVIDPTINEQLVAEASMFFTWKNSKVSAPIETLNTGSTPYLGAFAPELLLEAYSLVENCAPALEQSLLSSE